MTHLSSWNGMLIPEDLMFSAVKVAVTERKSSPALLEEKLGIGYAHAALLVDEMERLGLVGGYRGGKPRRILMTAQHLEKILSEQAK